MRKPMPLARRIAAAAALSAVLLGMLPAAIRAQPETSNEHRKLFVEGARLWPIYCAQCHNARSGAEFSPAQWDAIMMHMRTQSNIPAKDIRAITEFLKTAR